MARTAISNDPTYNPNNTENGTWHLMTEAQ